MKKLFFLGAFIVTGFASASTISESSKETKSENIILITECNTQSTQDADGDNISVTCCRTTYQEAYDCAAAKLRKLAFAPEEPAPQN